MSTPRSAQGPTNAGQGQGVPSPSNTENVSAHDDNGQPVNSHAPPGGRVFTGQNNASGNRAQSEAESAEDMDRKVILCTADAKAWMKELRKQTRKRKLEEEVGVGLIRIRTDIFEPPEDEPPASVPSSLPPPVADPTISGPMERLQELRFTTMSKLLSYVTALQPTVGSAKSEDDLKQLLKASMEAAEGLSQGLDELNIQLQLQLAGSAPVVSREPMSFQPMSQYMEQLMRCFELLPRALPEMKVALEVTQYRIARIIRHCGNWGEPFKTLYSTTLSSEKSSTTFVKAADFVQNISPEADSLNTVFGEHERLGAEWFTKILDRFEQKILGTDSSRPATNATRSPPSTNTTTILKKFKNHPPRT